MTTKDRLILYPVLLALAALLIYHVLDLVL